MSSSYVRPIMRRLYTYLFYLCVPFIILRLLYKSRRAPAYRQRINERFTLNIAWPKKTDVWLHAVSLGEVVAATALIEALLADNYQILVTTMTPTGSQQVINYFKGRVAHQYVPYDLPCLMRRFFKFIRPRIGIIMETELWPNIIHQAHLATIPLLIANARLSDAAFKHYKKARYFFQPVLNEVTHILAQSQLDAQRFMALGATSAAVTVVGNLKFDLKLPITVSENIKNFSQQWGKNRQILILASTHEGEEREWLLNVRELQQAIPDLLLLIAPRHPERFNIVYMLAKELGFNVGLRSQESSIIHNVEVIVLDSMGELRDFYQVSDYAFVGGSLVPIGGHNVLEPMMAKIPVLCGQYMQNSKKICEDLCKDEALYQGKDIRSLITRLKFLYNNPKQKAMQVAHANRVLELNKGVLERCLSKVKTLL